MAGIKLSVVRHLEVPALLAVPLALLGCVVLRFEHTALLSLLVVVAALLVFFARFELSKPSLRQVMPTVVLAALAAAGRILFAPFPDFKPVTAVCIVSGVVFGRHAGFTVGALAALVSNFFFGQGPWTPWQMYAWGMVGYFAGVLADKGFFGKPTEVGAPPPSKRGSELGLNPGLKPGLESEPNAELKLLSKPGLNPGSKPGRKQQLPLLIYGVVSALLYGFLLNTWTILGFVQPLTWQTALLAYAAGLPFDIVHAIATVLFLGLIMLPWQRKLERIKRKYGLSP